MTIHHLHRDLVCRGVLVQGRGGGPRRLGGQGGQAEDVAGALVEAGHQQPRLILGAEADQSRGRGNGAECVPANKIQPATRSGEGHNITLSE